jgi:hypothetical protein
VKSDLIFIVFIIPYLYEAQHVSGNTAHHQEPKKTALAASVFHFWYVVGCVVGGRCQAYQLNGGVVFQVHTK